MTQLVMPNLVGNIVFNLERGLLQTLQIIRQYFGHCPSITKIQPNTDKLNFYFITITVKTSFYMLTYVKLQIDKLMVYS